MGYDTRPLLTLSEKEKFLNMAAEDNFYLFLEHDAHNEIITVQKTEKGIRLKNIYNSQDIFS
jgi:beta-galactosidase beta subunit